MEQNEHERFSRGPSKVLGLILVMFLSLFWYNDSYANEVAGRDNWNQSYFSTSWDLASGCMKVHFKYLQSWGAYGSGYCGLSEGGYMDLSVWGYNIHITCSDPKSDNIKFNCTESSGKYIYSDTLPRTTNSSGEFNLWADVYIPIPQDQISSTSTSSATLKYTLKWWREGVGLSDDTFEDKTSSVNIDTRMASVTFDTPSSYGVRNNLTSYNINWNKHNDYAADILGTLFLCDENGNAISGVNTYNATPDILGTFVLYTKDFKLDESKKYIIRQEYVPTHNSAVKYFKESPLIIRPAYPQISKVTDSYDYNNLKLKLNWELDNAPASDYIADNFYITCTRKSVSDGTSVSTITEGAYKGGTTSYSTEYDVPVNGEYDYSFSLIRKDVKDYSQWVSTYGKTYTTHINSKHYTVKTLSAKLAANNRDGELNWTYDGGFASDGTKYIIQKDNLTGGSSTTIELNEAEFKKCKFVDSLLVVCNSYQFTLKVQPGSTKYTSSQAKAQNRVIPIEIGKMVSLIASKGYYSERTQLTWKTEGGFDKFSINRKEYGTDDSQYEQIDTKDGSNVQNTYTFQDIYGVPGTVYEYQVIGYANCAGATKESALKPTSIGFRTPTGDIYGRVTYSNGQAVEGVEVRTEMAESSFNTNKVYKFGKTSMLTVDDKTLLKAQADSATVQAWVNVKSEGPIIRKGGMYNLSVSGGKPVFTVGTEKVTGTHSLADFQKSSKYVHLSGVCKKDSILLYVNGIKDGGIAKTGTIVGNDSIVKIGGDGFEGNIDEVRIWSKGLDGTSIIRDYNRYITGGEKNLLAYYTFDYSVANEFFDTSYAGAKYNERHGTVTSATMSNATEDIPTVDQLGFKGITGTDGSYSIRAIPYMGNGTSYMIIPRKGNHAFESEKELRLISANTQSHTVNFTDKSSFGVGGWIKYKGGTIPVAGVSFAIDGVTVMDSKSNIVKSAADGSFNINVPVGQHEVKAVFANHIFENGGKITNSDGSDRNYQDIITGIILKDITTVRYVGRVAGGTLQEAFPIGHSLSTNNLADSVKIILSYANDAYKLSNADSTVTMTHFLPTTQKVANTNVVNYNGNNVTIYPNMKTGEFIADLIPENFNVKVVVPGHDKEPISGSGSVLNLSNVFFDNWSVVTGKDKAGKAYTDSVKYNKSQLFIKRYSPRISISQLDSKNKELEYFGNDSIKISTLLASQSFKVPLYDIAKKAYTLKYPVYEQGQNVKFLVKAYEEYVYMDAKGNPVSDRISDKVPTTDAKFKFSSSDLPYDASEELKADSLGRATYTFQVNNPELTGALRIMSAQMTYGDSENPISIDWAGKFNAIVIGSRMRGTNFVTNGPNKLLTILRDPPGSNSYSFLEKGTSFTTENKYSGNITNDESEIFNTSLTQHVITFAGVGAGTIKKTDVNQENKNGIAHTESLGGSDSKVTTTTTTTKFQTSSDPLYVGANGDVYVGYSTNITFGGTDNVAVVSKAMYDGNPSSYIVYSGITPASSDWLLVKTSGIGLSENFKTLFAYPQVYIENILIPEIETVRNSLLHQESENLDWGALANQQGKAVHVSKLKPEDLNYGKSNSNKIFKQNLADVFDGESYKIYFPSNVKAEEEKDTISALNNSIDNWKTMLARNEEEKVKAELKQNYSFHAGSPVEYSEGYSYTESSVVNFNLTIGYQGMTTTGVKINGTGVILEINEKLTTTHGGEFTTTEESNHSKGFVLADNGDDDYMSVDVCTVKKEDPSVIEYPSFIFKTKGGATSCPYQGEYKTKYYEPGQHVIDAKTVQIEVPEISVAKDFINNVPSGQPAYFTLYLRNNSELNEDGNFNLRIVDGTNPNGAKLYMDGAPIGNGRTLLVPAGQTLTKTLEVSKGSIMDYDNVKLMLTSQCQYDPTDFLDDIADTVSFSVHFTPSATAVNVNKPATNWVYNTKLPTFINENGLPEHYMEVKLDGFDVNYDNFHRIMLQYKPASASDDSWNTLMSYYNDSTLYKQSIANGLNAAMIKESDKGTITYRWRLDNLQDQNYDLRAVGTSMINNEEITNISAIHSGIKDMYNPRLFGSAQPANGILTIDEEIRLNFNEKIAEGYLTNNNFEVTGVRNGAQTDHSVSVALDGENDELDSEFSRNWSGKDVTVEMWVNAPKAQNATYFSHGTASNYLEFGITSDNHLRVKVGKNEFTSSSAVPFAKDDWAHVAMTCSKSGGVSAFYNFKEYISNVNAGSYTGDGTYRFGASVDGTKHFAGKMHNARIWDSVVTSGRLQTNSLVKLSGSENNLLAYYPMDEVRGTTLIDEARGVNLSMGGAEWVLPDGKAAVFDGTSQYVRVNTGSTAVIDNTMDYTMEFWFKGALGQKDATMVSNGRGDALDMGGSRNLVSVGFENGVLTYRNNGVKAIVDGNYVDNNWHHFAVGINRTGNNAQIFVDGELKTYFDADSIGGIAAPYMYLGARGWTPKENASKVNIDNYFKGEIDEFRIWDLYKNKTLINNGNIERLNGTEKGLLAYYPFEHYITWQGTKELKFTLGDMKVQKDPAIVVADGEAFGGNVETSSIAPVRDKGPVSNLLYDFVVNNDGLIINLGESESRIDKTIITFTVDGVRDVNGNEILSPITWSAYIDRNQLRWNDSELQLEKDKGAALEFEAKLVNTGGKIKDYSIQGLPSWLTATPSSGSISPTGNAKIVFTVNEGLNVGTYNEMIYARSEDGVAQGLPLTIKVNGDKPNWSVNPSDFKYNMAVFGKMRFDGVFSSDKEDMIAAFEGGKCVGVATNTYDKERDMWYSFLTVYSNNKDSHNIQFRMWDSSTDKTYSGIPNQAITFENDKIYGSASTPVIFDGSEILIQNLGLRTGWNWISINVANADMNNINSVLSSGVWKSGDAIKDGDNFADYSEKENTWTGVLTGIGLSNAKMYQMYSTIVQTVGVYGGAIDANTTPISVKGNGWSHIGYIPTSNLTVKEALADYQANNGDIIKSQTQFAMYSNGWVGSLTYMEANKGYMLKRTASNDVNFRYPTIQGTLNGRAILETPVRFNSKSDNMGIVATSDALEVGDRILAYVDGELRGESECVETPNGNLEFISVNGEQGEGNVTFALERAGKVVAQSRTVLGYGSNNQRGTLDEPMNLDFSGSDGSVMMYPNPFETEVTIDVMAMKAGDIDVEVYDLTGSLIMKRSYSGVEGVNRFTWDGSTGSGVSCPAGMYLVRVKVDGILSTHKVEKIYK